MPNIRLCTMTLEMCRTYFRQFEFDPDIFLDMTQFCVYHYTQEQADSHWQRQNNLNREHLAVIIDDTVIGEVVLKNIDYDKKCCTMGIHLINNSVKNKGYGTNAEILALQYAFNVLGMETVYADAILKNLRSQHVLTKVGFVETHSDDSFRYYRCDKAFWRAPAV